MAAPRKPQDQNGRTLGPRALQTRQRLLDATAELLERRSVRELRVVEIARAISEAFVEHWDRHGAVLRVRNLKAEEGDRSFRRVRVNALSPVVEHLAKRIEEFKRGGRVSAGINPWAAASSLVAMLERMSSYHQSFERAGVTRDQLVETCARIVFSTVTGRSA
jgi:hypothetical protein